MRTATPLVTCSRIAECGPSATSGVTSTPRLIGPGARIRMSSLALRQPLAVHGVQMGVLADRGERPRRLPLELDPQQVQHVARAAGSRRDCSETSTPNSCHSGETSVDGPQTITWAPSFFSPQMFERAVRLWAMSPTRATVSPAMPPELLADGHDVQQPLRGVLVRHRRRR